MSGNIIRDKSYEFSLRIVKMYKFLIENKVEYVLAKQILRSGTSIGANVEEACSGQSRKDFIHKLSIAQKEAFETRYWLRLLGDSEEIKPEYANSMLNDCDELISILTSIIKTTKENTHI
ncbi:MAG: four helix bundle protein [Tissierellia bacterium]|nr:four helix bundle protein [Tissierellia bacterium]